MKIRILFLLSIAVVLSSCSVNRDKWSDSSLWFDTGKYVDTDKVDLIYLVSTDIPASYDEDSTEIFTAPMTAAEKEAVSNECRFVFNALGDSFNFIAPYYSQFTYNAIALPPEEFAIAYETAKEDVFAAFDYYMQHINGGRDFILAGFSQGAMLALDLLKHMNDEQYSRMVATYMMGYRITAEDLACPHISPAADSMSRGVAASFNSVSDTAAIWHLLTDGAAVCTNPVNWSTGPESAILHFDGDTLSVSVDTTLHVLTVSNVDEDKYFFQPLSAYCRKGNLHHWDLLFYLDKIHENAVLRAYR